MSYAYVPVIQNELHIFRETVWNTHSKETKKTNNFQLVYLNTYTPVQINMVVRSVVMS